MTRKYDTEASGKNSSEEQLYSVVDLTENLIVKTNLLAKDAALFIENLTLLEESQDYFSKKYLDLERAQKSIPKQYYEVIAYSYNHDILALSLRLDRLINSLKDAKKEENYTRAKELIKKLSNFRTAKAAEPLINRLKRAYYLFKTI